MTTDSEVASTFGVVSQLRLHLVEEGYPAMVRRMRTDGYRLVAVMEGEEVRCVAGFRVHELLAYGKVLYVDDLVTDEQARSGSHGRRMMYWLAGEAERNGCEKLQLDSGVQRGRAHRFYFREGMEITSYHFSKAL